MRVDSIDCGQSICRSRIVHAGAEDFMELFRAARTETALQGGSHFSREELPDGTYRTELYVSRPGEELPLATD